MADLNDADLRLLSVHRVGNKGREEGFLASPKGAALEDDALLELLRKYLLAPFKINNEYFKFTHTVDLEYNTVYNLAKQVFAHPDGLHLQSINLLKHLYDNSDHPKVKAGEFYAALFVDCRLNGERVYGLGLFKSEGKDSFLRFEEQDGGLNVSYEWGVPVKAPDKACLILSAEQEDGFRVLAPDNASAETQYWIEDFLGLQRINDNHFQTQSYLQMCKNFVDDVYGQEMDKKEQVTFLNRSLDYFNTNERFDLEEFAGQVIPDEDYQQQFKAYKNTYEQENGVEVVEDFAIFKPAVKTMKRKFKNLIKLDTEIEIKLNPGNEAKSEQFVERGYDEEKRMFFYKVYFNSEA